MKRRVVFRNENHTLESFLVVNKDNEESIHFTLQESDEHSDSATPFRLGLKQVSKVVVVPDLRMPMDIEASERVEKDLTQANLEAITLQERIEAEIESWKDGTRESGDWSFSMTIDTANYGCITEDEFRELVTKTLESHKDWLGEHHSSGGRRISPHKPEFMNWRIDNVE